MPQLGTDPDAPLAGGAVADVACGQLQELTARDIHP